uniref:uncharacterized protein LOC120346227 isoform X1 n=1 Tax=Styela clava TaxID=7725 RepID=UPI001939D805|nr:uncharacterized protein LOC120346227 isoform X1 [Styela clava]
MDGMKRYRVLLVFWLATMLTPYTRGETLYCKPRAGCGIDSCDPIAAGWNEKIFDLTEHLHREEFPIICKQTKTDSSKIQEELGTVEKKVSILEDLNVDLANEVVKLKERNNRLFDELNSKALKLSEVQTKVVTLEKRFSVMEERFERMNSISVMDGETASVENASVDSEYCMVKVDETCYWIKIQDGNYYRAKETCKKHDFKVADIPNEKTYRRLYDKLRNLIPDQLSWMKIWTGIEINTQTGKINPLTSYIEWQTNLPHMGRPFIKFTNVYIDVGRNSKSIGAMGNIPPSDSTHGLICQF